MGSKADEEVDDEVDDQVDDEVDDQVDDETDEQSETADIPDLETEKSPAQRREHEGKGLKILTLEQMLSRLLISLARLQNNSQKLKNEIKQLLHSLYC